MVAAIIAFNIIATSLSTSSAVFPLLAHSSHWDVEQPEPSSPSVNLILLLRGLNLYYFLLALG